MFSCQAHTAEPRPQIVHTRQSRAHESRTAAKPPSRVRAHPMRCPYLPVGLGLVATQAQEKVYPSKELCHACRRHDLHTGHRSYALRDETPVHI